MQSEEMSKGYEPRITIHDDGQLAIILEEAYDYNVQQRTARKEYESRRRKIESEMLRSNASILQTAKHIAFLSRRVVASVNTKLLQDNFPEVYNQVTEIKTVSVLKIEER